MGSRPSRSSSFGDSIPWLQPLAARVGQWIGTNSSAQSGLADQARTRSAGRSSGNSTVVESQASRGAPSRRASELQAAREDLAQLLHQHPKARRVVPHLAHVAMRLKAADLSVLQTLPCDVASRALQQLDSLAGDCTARPGLKALRQRLLVAAHPGSSTGPVTAISAFGPTSQLGLGQELLVEEGSLDVFEQEERAWSDTHQPPPREMAADSGWSASQ